MPALRHYQGKSAGHKSAWSLATLFIIGLVSTFIAMFFPHSPVAFDGPVLPLVSVKADQQ